MPQNSTVMQEQNGGNEMENMATKDFAIDQNKAAWDRRILPTSI